MAVLLNGRELARQLKESLKKEIHYLITQMGGPLTLAVVQVGEDPASDIYVAHKVKACQDVGLVSQRHHFPHITPEALIAFIHQLNQDPQIHGILVQLPLPPPLKAAEIIAKISPHKDVDGLHPLNQGLLWAGTPRFVPCTPLGCLHLIRSVYPDLSGKKALVVGRSVLVGRPLSAVLLNAHATVTIAHSHTSSLEQETKQADIIIMAAGRHHLLKGPMVKPGAMVIDVGIHRLPSTTVGQSPIQGDVDFESVDPIAGYLTPVPGGVGPLTVAYLLSNTVYAARLQHAQSTTPGIPT